MPSIFSRIIAGELPAYKIAENERFYAFLDIFPLEHGHTLIVPKQEIDYIFDLDDDLLSEILVFSKKVAAAIQKAVPCKRIGILVEGLEVPHAHVHLIPIKKHFPRRKLRPAPSKETFEKTAAQIRQFFNE